MRLSGRWLLCGAAVLLPFAAGWFYYRLNLIRDLKRADSARSQRDSPLGRATPNEVEAENAVHP